DRVAVRLVQGRVGGDVEAVIPARDGSAGGAASPTGGAAPLVSRRCFAAVGVAGGLDLDPAGFGWRRQGHDDQDGNEEAPPQGVHGRSSPPTDVTFHRLSSTTRTTRKKLCAPGVSGSAHVLLRLSQIPPVSSAQSSTTALAGCRSVIRGRRWSPSPPRWTRPFRRSSWNVSKRCSYSPPLATATGENLVLKSAGSKAACSRL